MKINKAETTLIQSLGIMKIHATNISIKIGTLNTAKSLMYRP